MFRRHRPKSEAPPTGDPHLDLGDDPSYKLGKVRAWGVIGISLVLLLYLLLQAAAFGRKMDKQTPPTEDLLRQGASDYACNLSRTWFTWDSDNVAARGEALKVFNPAWDARKGWNGQGKQSVAYTTSPLTKKIEGKDNEYEVTCGLFFSDPNITPIFNTVRVLSDPKQGGYSPLSLPVVTSNPGVPVPGHEYNDLAAVQDLQADSNIASPVSAQAKSFMNAWGKGDITVLKALVAPDFEPAPLSGSLALDSVSEIRVYRDKNGTRTYADMKIRWINQAGSAIEASYRLDFVEKDGRWLVSKVDTVNLDAKAYVTNQN
jgi:hypothetical protein